MIRRLALAIALLMPGAALTETFSAAEREAIREHGPWPQAALSDPTNRFSGDPGAIAFGERLFFERSLSAEGDVACAQCHRPDMAFTDGRKTARGTADGARNTLSLWNVGQMRWFGWGGASDTLWGASVRPLALMAEMGAPPEGLRARLRQNAALWHDYRAIVGQAAEDADGSAVTATVGKLLAAYQETLISPRTAFDRFRAALLGDDPAGVAAYPATAKRGLKLFIGKGNCNLCHAGPLFATDGFESVGMPHFIGPGAVDKGRYGDLLTFRASAMKASGPHSDAPGPMLTDQARLQHKDFGAFRVPSLRQAALTAPYMHNGALPTLEAVIRHYSDLDMERLHADGAAILRPLHLSKSEIADLVAFLETLSAAP